jgi:uncharacterized membrane protein
MDIKTKFEVGDLLTVLKDNVVVDVQVKRIIVTVDSSNTHIDYVTEYIYRVYNSMNQYDVISEEYILHESKCFINKKELLENL